MSIKVGVRVRPFNTREKDSNSHCVISMEGNQTIITDDNGNEKKFTFDHSFWSHDSYDITPGGYYQAIDDKYADQRNVFDAVGKQILDNAWEGYHCCLFAYGQTGSGKSYSMVGYGDNKGIVPISCDEIFSRIRGNTDPDKAYEVQVSMLEIYNEKVQDLLTPAKSRPASGLKVRESKVLGIFVEGLTKYPVQSYEEISSKMEEGYENRTIGSTLMNATSSRAHTIVTIEFKQLTKVGGKRSEKLSMINLVDLAGSERAGNTGATGDRLKEGCNINKSLLILGNVINVLADKATGKKKDVLPPYRDSVLTRILQNALGGNSKTVMICALSPASINYEETLSTLRYADRAKKIQNKAIINESEHDKMIRMLRDENNGLKKMIEDLNMRLMGSDGVIGDEDKAAFLELKDQYDSNMKVMNDMEKTFEERLEEAKLKSKETIGEKVDLNLPHLIVLNEDPQLSHKLKYSLAKLPVHVGRKLGNPPPQIILSGIGIKQNHAMFIQDNDDMIIKANDPDANDYIFINGKKIGSDQGQILNNNDRIIFGTNTIFIYKEQSNGKDIYDYDWETAQVELQKEVESSMKRQEILNERRKQDELDLLKKDLEEKYEKEKEEYELNLKRQLKDYELKMKEMLVAAEKTRIETEKKNMEMLMKQKIEFLEGEKIKKKKELELREEYEQSKKESLAKDHDIIHQSKKLENTLKNIIVKLTKLRIVITELKRNINLQVVLLRDYSSQVNPQPVIIIRVENYEEGTVYYWNTDTLHNRFDLMNEIFDRYYDEEFDMYNIRREEDPLWDEPTHALLGFAIYKLEPLAYLMSNELTVTVISNTGVKLGALRLDIIPHDDQGHLYEDVPEDPYELIGQALNFKVALLELIDLPEDFCRSIRISYHCFCDNLTYQTKVLNVNKETNSPKVNEFFEHRIEYLNKDDIDFLVNDKICFKVFAYEEVEKKGKIPREAPIEKGIELKSLVSNAPKTKDINRLRNDFKIINKDEVKLSRKKTEIDNSKNQHKKSSDKNKGNDANKKGSNNNKKSKRDDDCLIF